MAAMHYFSCNCLRPNAFTGNSPYSNPSRSSAWGGHAPASSAGDWVPVCHESARHAGRSWATFWAGEAFADGRRSILALNLDCHIAIVDSRLATRYLGDASATQATV